MAKLAHFQNFAKLKDTSVEFNDITVLAGKPGTGKSYVMKFIYGIHEASNKATEDAKDMLSKKSDLNIAINTLVKELAIIDGYTKEKPLTLNDKKISELPGFFKTLNKVSEIQKEAQILNNMRNNYKGISEENFNSKSIGNILTAIFTDLSQISKDFNVRYLDQKISISNDELIVKEDIDSIIATNNIFVESPLIIEFHKHMDRREAKTPYHIESLLNILDKDYSFTDEDQDELIKKFSKKTKTIIGGDIKNRDGSFMFSRNDDKDYNIFNTSSGTKSIGLLQYLVTNKALKKGSVLFWEEPEVHLHPEWQLKMVDLFVEL